MKFKFWSSSAFTWALVGWSVAFAIGDTLTLIRTGELYYLAPIVVFVVIAVWMTRLGKRSAQQELDNAFVEGKLAGWANARTVALGGRRSK